MEQVFYVQEHLECPNYESEKNSSIEEKRMVFREEWELKPTVNKIVFVIKGKMECFSGKNQGYIAAKEQVLFLPAGHHFLFRAVGVTNLLIIRLMNRTQFCDSFRLEDLQQEQVSSGSKKEESTPTLLTVNPVLKSFLDLLLECHRQGLHCRYYNESKIKELMFILRAFYVKEELAGFFSPVLTNNTPFSQFIMDNYSHYNSLSDMAAAMNYTVSGFEKKFRRVFGCAPYSWLKKRKALDIYHYISTTEQPLKEISVLFGFNGSAAFTTYVKQVFGLTPGQIRKNKKNGAMPDKLCEIK